MGDLAGRVLNPAGSSGSDVLSRGVQQRNDGRLKQRALAFKVSHILLSLLFLWLIVIHGIGLFFFTKGFLLTRLVLENQSECAILPDGSPSLTRDGCWHPRTFRRAVIIVIDALRYDFAVPFQPSPEQVSPDFYHNNLQFMYNTALKHPDKAILLPFIADPPTSTLQRLKGLTAGNLPTFIDIGSSFAGSANEEDNILVQLNSTRKKIVHLGDDTWHSLFPGYFDQQLTHAYDSFNVWDLHTVDNGVIEHLLPLLRDTPSSRWDVVFAHFLGVDHAGHRYGPSHPAMAEKLRQMDSVLEDVAAEIDEETLLIVMGDHGMDPKGDHGGESDEEVQSTLWMYSKRARFGRLDATHQKPPTTAKERPVEQIDLVSTLSLLLGLPIPFNNLGKPIPEAFIGPGAPDWANLGRVNLLAYDQMQRYQKEYLKSRELDIDQHLLHNIETLRDTKHAGGKAYWPAINEAYSSWHQSTIRMYRSLWANFDTVNMLMGVTFSGLSLVMLLILYRVSGPDVVNTLPILLRNIGLVSVFGGVTGGTASTFLPSADVFTGSVYGAAVFGVIHTIYHSVSSWDATFSIEISIWSWFSLVFTATQAAGFAANSFTIHEDTILLFFLSTFGAFALMSSLRQAFQPDRVLGAYHSILFVLLTRLASFSRLCREEQMPGCQSTFYASQTSSTSAPWHLVIPLTIAAVLPEIIKAFYRGTASYVSSAPFWVGLSFRTGLLFVTLYWAVDAADNGNWLADRISASTMKTIEITVARCALAVAIPVGLATFIWASPCIDISIVQEAPSPAMSEPPRPQITVLGYANAFGSRYFLLVPTVVLAVILLLPPMGQFSLSILTWQILCLLEILDTNRLTISRTASSSIGPVILAMLGSYHFFKTGHQAVLSSIQWSAAFVPFRTLTYPFAPILVILNTFGAQILCAAVVPLTVLWKRPVSGGGVRGVWSDIMKACLAHTAYYAVIQLATTMWAGHLRRHLMLYRVFMPRFLMASGVLLVVDVILLLVSLSGARITGDSVAEVFGY